MTIFPFNSLTTSPDGETNKVEVPANAGLVIPATRTRV